MEKLERRDLLEFIRALNLLHADVGKVELSERILKAAADMIDADTIGFDIFSLSGEYENVSWRNIDFVFTPERLAQIEKYHHENPLFVETVLNRKTDVFKLTDFMPVDEFRKTNIYQLIYKIIDADYQMTVALPISDEFTLACLFTRKDRDFTERDRQVLQFLVPHFANAIANDMAFKRLAGLLENQVCGMVVIAQDGKSLVVSKYAADLLTRYFAAGENGEGSLPETITKWLERQAIPESKERLYRAVEPMTIDGRDGRLTVRLVYDTVTGEQTLLLEEKKTLTPKMLEKLALTKRESEILYWIAQGKSDAEIAMLCRISRRTVSKHAGNIFDKLGVENRSTAVRRALETLMSMTVGTFAELFPAVENTAAVLAVLG